MKMLHMTLVVCGMLFTSVVSQASAAWTWQTFDYLGAYKTLLTGVSGNTVVASYNDSQNPAVYNGSTWITPSFPGATRTYVIGVSGDDFVGWCSSTGTPGQGFVLNGNTGNTYTYPGSLGGTVVTGIDGNNVVGNYHPLNPSDPLRGFACSGGTYTPVDYPNAAWTKVTGISGDTIVGTYQLDSAMSNDQHGFVYRNGTYTSLDFPVVFGPMYYTSAFGISGNNIVGFYGDSSGSHGFLYDGSTWSSLDYPGAQGTAAYGISGNAIVGSYTDTTYNTHGFILTVPEPATFSLLALGGLLLARRKA